MPEKWVLRQYQSLPLRAKVGMSQNRIIEWYDHFNGDVCVSFSGGKDSTVLAHLVHDFFPDVPLVFANTGLEYPEVQAFARKMGAEFVRPKTSFSEVISKYGYPIISKENAEAIYYARRIRNRADFGIISGGGVGVLHSRPETQRIQRLQSNGRRQNTLAEQQNGDGRTSRTVCQTQGYKHSQISWGGYSGQEKQTGVSGEETPSPG